MQILICVSPVVWGFNLKQALTHLRGHSSQYQGFLRSRSVSSPVTHYALGYFSPNWLFLDTKGYIIEKGNRVSLCGQSRKFSILPKKNLLIFWKIYMEWILKVGYG